MTEVEGQPLVEALGVSNLESPVGPNTSWTLSCHQLESGHGGVALGYQVLWCRAGMVPPYGS